MDFLILYCALKLLDIAIPWCRVVLAALFSSFGAVCLLQFSLSVPVAVVLRLLLFSSMIVFVVPPRKSSLFVRYFVSVLVLAVLCGGISFGVLFLQNGLVYAKNGQMLLLHFPAYLCAVGACGVILLVLSMRKWISNLRIRQNTAEVQIEVLGQKFSCRGYFDTGHLQKDPATGRSVIVVSAQVFSPWINCEPHFCAMSFLEQVQDTALCSRVGLLCVKTVSGDGMLVSIRPDEVLVDAMPVHAVIALFPNTLDQQNRFAALLPVNIKKKV